MIIEEPDFVEQQADKILALDAESVRALNEHRLDDFHRLSAQLCARAITLAAVMKWRMGAQ